MLTEIVLLLSFKLVLHGLILLVALWILLAFENPFTASDVVQMAILAHHQINLGRGQALDATPRLRAAALFIQLLELADLKEVLNDLLQIFGHSWPVVGMQLLRELDVEAQYLDCDVSGSLVLEDHPRVWHLFHEC